MSDTQAMLEILKEDVRAISDTVDVVAQLAPDHTRQLATVGKRLHRIEIRLEEHGQRFDQVDRRFTQVDQRFDQVDGELQTIKGQLTEILARLAS
jgi:chromosome segregation ATPase